MKNQFIIILLSTCMLFGCERNNQKKNDENNKPATTVDSVKADNAVIESEPECDMQLVWDQIEKMYMDSEAENDASFTIDSNRISYELGMYQHRDREIVSYYDGTLFKVFDVYNYENIYDDEIESEAHHIKEYLFKDGKLTECELQDELNGFKKAYFDEEDLVASDEEGNRTVFFWNGKKMEKKE